MRLRGKINVKTLAGSIAFGTILLISMNLKAFNTPRIVFFNSLTAFTDTIPTIDSTQQSGDTVIIRSKNDSAQLIKDSNRITRADTIQLSKNSFAKIPLFGWYYKKGAVLVDRKSERSRIHSFEEMKQVLKAGMNMCIFPEGTRNRTKEPLKKFYDGAFKLAEVTKAPIIPAIIFNTKKAMPIHNKFYLWPHKLALHFLPPVEAGELSAQELKEKVFSIMKDYYETNAANPFKK